MAMIGVGIDLWLVVQSLKYTGNCSCNCIYVAGYECQSTADLAIKATADVTLIRKSELYLLQACTGRRYFII